MAPKDRVLIVDDAPDTLEVIERSLAAQGYEVMAAAGVREAVEILKAKAVDLVVTDLKMPGISGLELVRHVRENHPDTEVLMITGYPSVEGAVQAVKLGAEDFLPKPFTNEELLAAVRSAFDKLKAMRTIQKGTRGAPAGPGLLGESAAMRRLFRAIERAAAGSSAPVLIVGEGGTGKELVARAIHYASERALSPFIPVNLAAIPAPMVETELFGRPGGPGRAGLLRSAQGGTLFLDEITTASATVQARLATLLDEEQTPANARLVAASSKDLTALGRKGGFNEALLYRLGSLAIEVPPLRERGDDVLLLAHHFVTRFAQEASRQAPRFSDQVVQALRSYDWPGNVRELAGVVQRLVLMSGASGEVCVPDLPPPMRFSAVREHGLNRSLAAVETEHIRGVLAAVGGNRTQAAEVLGIDRKTLREKLKRTEKA